MFESLQRLPADPILGVSAAYRADNSPTKVDLSVGVYKDAQGHTPVMGAVKAAEKFLLDTEDSKAYLSPAGNPGFNRAIGELLLGPEHVAVAQQRVATVQTAGGCGALRSAAELVLKANPGATIWLSNPTWGNHVPLLGNAGVNLASYPYYDSDAKALDFEHMVAALEQASGGDLVLLHGCCHNPTGADLSLSQWQQLTELFLEKKLTPFVDVAYQGLGDGLEEDVQGLRAMAQQLPEMIITASCSKNFGLYRERTGALLVIAKDSDKAQDCLSQLNAVTRGLYSMPPAHGAAIVEVILNSSELNDSWRAELRDIRQRVSTMRRDFVAALRKAGVSEDFAFIAQQKGMFSFLGISPEQALEIRRKHSVYLLESGRINVAGITPSNVDYLARAVAAIL